MASLDTQNSEKPKKKRFLSDERTTLLIVDVDKTESISVNTKLLYSIKPIVITTAVALFACVALIFVLFAINVNKSIQVKRASNAEAEAVQTTNELRNEVKKLQVQSSKEIEAKLDALEATEQTVNELHGYLKDRGVNAPVIAPINDLKQNSTSDSENDKSQETADNATPSSDLNSFDADIVENMMHQGGPAADDVAYMTEYGEQIKELSDIARKVPLGLPHDGELSSGFGRRSNPFGGSSRETHRGLDFKGATGEPIETTADGEVVTAGRLGGYGLVVKVKHGYGFMTVYAHLSKVDVKVGQKVKAGDVIGKLGSTGRSTGPHLHYEVRQGNEFLNPKSFVSLSAPAPSATTTPTS